MQVWGALKTNTKYTLDQLPHGLPLTNFKAQVTIYCLFSCNLLPFPWVTQAYVKVTNASINVGHT